MSPAATIARSTSERGEVVLRRHENGVLELRVNGIFVMDDRETRSEELLATLQSDRERILVGGLGLGHTVRALLGDSGARRVVVAEIEPSLVRWMRDGLIPSVLDDNRVEVRIGDIRDIVHSTPPGTVDGILLDVDNGPDYLVYADNVAIYQRDFLTDCRRILAPGGKLAVWSSTNSAALAAEIRAVFGSCRVHPVELSSRAEGYFVLSSGGFPTLTAMADDEFRIEHDTMGEVRVPKDALWRAQTQRAVENFPVSGRPLDPALIHALAQIKASAAVVNAELGVVDRTLADRIVVAGERVAAGEHDDQFPIDVFQTGSGTSTNMNVNEVLATLAGDGVHPNDHVNASQSSNDTFPSAIHVATTAGIVRDLLPALEHLADSLARKGSEFADVVKSGRTHLMDATPVTMGQEFTGYATQVRRGADRVKAALPRVAELPLGGTAVGTGINTPAGFAARVIQELNRRTGLELTEADDHFEAQGARDGLVELSGQLKTIAVSLTKICNDLRWMGSGPRAGLGEIALPDLQPGSSIMPGKVNPVICEATLMVAAQVIGNDACVTAAGAAGNFELNVMLPVIARNVLESIRLLANASRLLADRCVDGITANVDHCRTLAESSPAIVTPLNRYIGYENAAAVAKSALKQGKTIRQVVIEEGYVDRGALTGQQLDAALDVLSMTRPS